MSGRAPTSAEFEPTPIAPRRRRIDPMLIGALIVLVGLGASIVKPWEAPPGTTDDERATAAPSAEAAGPSSPVASGSRGPALVESLPITWPEAATAIGAYDRWGVRAIVRSTDTAPDRIGLVERWAEAVPGGDGRHLAVLPTADQGVLALGLTFPPDAMPLDARIWRATADGAWEWLHAPALEPSPAFGAFVYGPPRIDGHALATWPTGRYRVQVLTGAAILELTVDLPDRFEVVPGPGAGGRPQDPAAAFDPELRPMGGGRPFAVQDDVATALIGGPGEPLDLAAAWGDVGRERRDPTLDLVPSVYLPRATALGVVLATGATDVRASIRGLAPDVVAIDAGPIIGRHPADVGARPFVAFRPPTAATWPAGVYRIDVAWTPDGGAATSSSWHVELRPGPAAPAPTALAALRVLVPIAETSAIAGAGGLFLDAIGLDCTDGDVATSTTSPAFIGVGHEPGRAPTSIDAELLIAGGRALPVAMLRSSDPVPGLTLLAPADGAAFIPGVYRISLRGAEGVRVVTACLGVAFID